MSSNGGNDRVTNRQLYEALWSLEQKFSDDVSDLPTKSWVIKTVGSAIVVGAGTGQYWPRLATMIGHAGHVLWATIF